MGILLVRHAEAIAEHPGFDDAARWLTELGRAQAREVAKAVRERGLVLARVLTSPRVRAVQTAELFADGVGFRGVVESLPALSYTAPAALAARALQAYDAHEAVAAFGHMPTIAELAYQLSNGQHERGLSLSEALWIEGGRALWSATPAQCR